MRVRVLIPVLLGTAILAAPVSAQSSVAQWILNGSIDSSIPFPASSTSASCTAGDLTLSSALTSKSFASAFVGDAWPSGGIDLARYIEFWVAADVGSTLSPATVRFSLYNNFPGTSEWQIRSSVDNYSTVLDAGTATGLAPSGETINAAVGGVGAVSGRIYFRVYTYNNSGSTNPLQRGFRGSMFGGQDLTVLGTVTATPTTVLSTTTAYIEDFESGTGAWSVFGNIGSPWEYGTPAGATMNSAASGTRCFSVDRDGDYANSTSTFMQATFDFTAFTSDPMFRMQLWYDAELSWDGVNVQVDTGGGFTTVGTAGDPFGWYNSANVTGLVSGLGWTGDGGGWFGAAHALDGVAGTVATVRINFGSDSGVVSGEGAMVDDIRIVNAPVTPAPGVAYFEDLESGPGGWQTSGTGTQWEHGPPTASVIDSAFSGSNAFATDLDGGYLNSTTSRVERTFDLSAFVADPVFRMKLFHDCENNWDGVNVEVDTGAGFAPLGVAFEPNGNWFEDSDVDGLGDDVDGWSGTLSGWFTAAHVLDGCAGTLTTIRINFGSDPSVSIGDGAAIDDLSILDIAPRHPGTGEDLVTFYEVGLEGPFSTDNSITDEGDADPGRFVSVQHLSPGLTFVGSDFVVLGSLGPGNAAPLEVLPGLWLGVTNTFLVTPAPIPGVGAVKLTSTGYSYGFVHPGGAASGFSLFLQGVALDGLANNSIYASTDTLELRLN